MTESEPIPGKAIAAARFSRFVVMDRIGAGAMGVVYVAYDPTLDRQVALKILRGTANRGRLRARTQREALAMARISHPNVVSIYEVGEADGRLFIYMERLTGLTLDVWLQEKRRNWRTIVRVFEALARGLAAVHAKGLLHRDFKPSNVLVDESDRPVIIDLGLARLADDELSEPTAAGEPSAPTVGGESLEALSDLTRTGVTRGTPAYMAPEVLAGGAHTAASDQFSLCVAFFEAVYGVQPFPRDALGSMHYAMATGRIAGPPASGAPPTLLDTIRRGLSADPKDRFPDLGGLLSALGPHGDPSVDQARGRAVRIAFATAVVAVIAVLCVHDWLSAQTTGLWTVVWMSGLSALAVGVPLLALVPKLRRTSTNRDFAKGIIATMLTRQLAVTLGAHLGMTADHLLAVEAVVILGCISIVAVIARLDMGLATACAAALIGAMFVWPDRIFVLHHASATAIVLGVLRAEWTLWSKARATGDAPAGAG